MQKRVLCCFGGNFWLAMLVLLFYSANIKGQCPITNANYVSIADGDWSSPSTWKTATWVNPKVPVSSGTINNSIAINHNVVLHNSGQTLKFNQATSVCGTLTVDGNLSISGGCSPLHVYGKLIVNGDLLSSQSIQVHPGAELIVHGSWTITGGANTSIDGVMAVKGDVNNSQGVNLSTNGTLLVYGDYTAGSCSNRINGNVVVAGDLSISEWNKAGGSGSIYVLGTGDFGQTDAKDQAALEANTTLNNTFQQYQEHFGLKPLSVSISSAPASPICAETEVTYTAVSSKATNYSFYVNGNTVSAQSGASNVYSYLPNNGDVVKVVVSDGVSTVEAVASSIVVNPLPINTYSITAPAICAGSSGAATLSGSEVGVNYQIYHGSTAVGAAVAGTGAALDLTIPASASSGIYTVLATNAATGCERMLSTSFSLVVRPKPSSGLQISDTDAKICFGEQVIFTADEGLDKYEFFIDNAGQGEQAADNAFSINTLAIGNHDVYVKVTDANGCSNKSETKALEVLSSPAINSFVSSDPDNKICEGSEISFDVTAQNATTYEFFIGGVSQGVSTSDVLSVDNLASGNVDVYARVISSINGCSINTPTIKVNVQSLPTATILPQSPSPICAGSPITFTATGGDSYQYYINGSLVAGATNVTFTSSSLANGNVVSVAAKGSNGCVATAAADALTVNPLPNANLGSSDIDNIVCAGSAITFTAAEMDGATYEFRINNVAKQTGSSNTFVTTSLANGDKVSAKVTSGAGCEAATIVPLAMEVQQMPGRPKAISGDATPSGFSSVSETYTSGGLSSPNVYRWEITPDGYGTNGYDGNASFNVTWASNGSYELKVYGYNEGCGKGPEQTKTIEPSIFVSYAKTPVPNTTTFCKGSSVRFMSSLGTIGEILNYKFEWVVTDPDNREKTYTTSKNVFDYIPTKVGKYLITARHDVLFSPESPAFSFIVGDIPQNVNIAVDNNPVCKGSPVVFTASAVNSTSYEFSIDGVSEYKGGSNIFSISALDNNNIVLVKVGNACGVAPEKSIAMKVINSAPVTLTVSPNPICNGGTSVFTATPSGAIGYEFFINGVSAAAIADNKYEPADGTLANNSKVKVVMTDACGTSVSNEVTVTTLPLPKNVVLSVSPSSNVCSGTPVTFTATAGYTTYQFKKNGVNIGSASATNTYTLSSITAGDKITVMVTDHCGNKAESKNAITMSVSPVPTPTLAFPSGKAICDGQSLTVSAPAGWLNYEFLVNGTTYRSTSSNMVPISGLANGDKVSVKIKYTCGGVDAYATSGEELITVKPLPTAAIVADPGGSTICTGAEVKFTASGGGTYQFLLKGASIAGATSATYTKSDLKTGDIIGVRVTNNGCSATVSLPAYSVTSTTVVQWDSYSQKVCVGDPISIKLKQSFDSYDWSINDPFKFVGTPNQSAEIITGTNDSLFPVGSTDRTKNVVVTLKVKNGSCESAPATLTIPVYRIPRTGSPYHLKNNVAQ